MMGLVDSAVRQSENYLTYKPLGEVVTYSRTFSLRYHLLRQVVNLLLLQMPVNVVIKALAHLVNAVLNFV